MDMNEAVLTTRFVLFEKAPVMYVVRHRDDGMWQFNGFEETAINEDDYKIAGLGEVLALDLTLKTIVERLQPGYQAIREDANHEWEISLFLDRAGNDNNKAEN